VNRSTSHPLSIFSSVLIGVALLGVTSCGGDRVNMETIAESYVKLVLALGEHDGDYVDAYHGPEAWRADEQGRTLDDIVDEAGKLQADLAGPDDLRRRYLSGQLRALEAHARRLRGEVLTFDEESKALYDAVAPRRSAEYYQAILDRLAPLLPGDGELIDRYEAFKNDFIIPSDRLDEVFRVAIDACRERTAVHVDLPPDESFTIEYVTDKAWSGYNWYQGEFRSLIQVNTDLPIYIDRAIDLACHEGYPGHHVYNVLLEKTLLKENGWIEFSIYPLFSPQSLIAEGTANFGITMAFPGDQRIEYEREVLFPKAGLDATRVETYYAVEEAKELLAHAGNEAARDYLDGTISSQEAIDWMTTYAMMPRARAEQRIDFIDKYRSYVINYNLGQDMVRAFVEREGGEEAASRWSVFVDLLSSPRLPSSLVE